MTNRSGRIKFNLIWAGLAAWLLVVPAVRAESIGRTDLEVKSAAEPVLESVLQGLSTRDYAVYTQHFDPELKSGISPERFSQIVDNIEVSFGSQLYRDYLGFLNKNESTTVFWKAVFDRTRDEILIKLVLMRQGDTVVVGGLSFE